MLGLAEMNLISILQDMAKLLIYFDTKWIKPILDDNEMDNASQQA
jgi:hypothetical protein